MGSASFMASLFGWSFVPDFATRHLLNFAYGSPYIPIAPPKQGSREYRKHYAVTFSFVILTYLGYTIYESMSALPPSFYQILGVPFDVDETGLKVAFRAFAKRYHPDRPGVGPAGAALFMHVRDAFEALKDPVVRFAYDRFGPDVMDWRQQCKTPREFLTQGLLRSSGYHIVAGVALLFWSAIGQPSPVSFWRWVLFGGLFAAELSLILSPFPAAPSNIFPAASPSASFSGASTSVALSFFPSPPSILQFFLRNRVPYQHILFLHQLFMFLSVGLSRVVPQFIFLFSDESASEGKKLDPVEREIWERVYSTIAIADREASIILHTILSSVSPPTNSKPFHQPSLAQMRPVTPTQAVAAYEALTPEMQNLVIEANIKNQAVGPIANAWEAAVTKAKASSARTNGASGGSGTPTTTRTTRGFWEKDLADSEVVLVDSTMFANNAPSSPSTPHTDHRKTVVPSTEQSPVRRNASKATVEDVSDSE